jgi:light-regulated signal transduction histidine kinase (bacteriophytochrome)
MHKLLERQLRQHVAGASPESLPAEWRSFVEAVNDTYEAHDRDRALLGRSMELASKELLERNQELSRSNTELQQFAYIASHDLQEPLRMVSGYMQLLTRRYHDKLDHEAQEFIAYAVDGVQRLQRLINDLLAYSRVETRQRPMAPTSLTDVLREAISNLQMAMGETQAVITHDPLPTVQGDTAQLVQVLQNLLGNAIKFRAPDRPPRIHVGAKQDGGQWTIAVQDNGIGIDPQYADRIFVIFQRLHTAAEYPGTGIGLAVCKKIIERHGGRIWLDSQPGEGARFSFVLTAAN